MLADIRRRAKTDRVHITPSSDSPIQQHSSTFQFTASASPKRQDITTPVQTTELMAIKRDLTKIIILAAVAIGAELALFWFR